MSPKLESVSREWLLWSAIEHMSYTRRRKSALWMLVKDVTGYGSTSATQLCVELNWNPEAKGTDPVPTPKGTP